MSQIDHALRVLTKCAEELGFNNEQDMAYTSPLAGEVREAIDALRSALAAPVAEGAAITLDDEEEAYEIGKRDGYEEAVQDIDLATGGDGEYKGGLGDAQTVDMEVMRQRIIDRFKYAHPPAGVGESVWQLWRWYDHFNDCYYDNPRDADLARTGGNLVTELYRHRDSIPPGAP